MIRFRMAFHIVAVVVLIQSVGATVLPAQRPIGARGISIAPPSIVRPVETVGAYQRAVQQFRNSVSLVGVPLPTTDRTGLMGMQVTWATHPDASRYRVLRGMTATGPWVPVQEVREESVTIRYVPAHVMFYARILALRHDGERWVAIDTTLMHEATTGMVATGRHGVPDPRCASQAPLTAVIHWPPIPFAAAYGFVVTRSGAVTVGETGAGITSYAVSSQIVSDTVATLTDAAEGHYSYYVRTRFDFPDWAARGDTVRQWSMPSEAARGQVSGGTFTCL